MMEDSSMFIELILSELVIEEEIIDPDCDFRLKIFTNKNSDSDVTLIQTVDAETFKKKKEWVSKIDIKYFFEIRQLIIISLQCQSDAENDFKTVGNGLLTLGHFLCLPQQRQVIEFESEESSEQEEQVIAAITVKASKLTNTLRTGSINMNWRAGKIANVDSLFDFWNKNNSYLKFMKIRGDNTYADVAKTQIKFNELSPNWDNIKIPLKSLIDEKYKPISFKIQCWHKGEEEEKQIGETFIQLQELKKQKIPIQFHLQSVNVKKPGNLILQSYDILTFPNLVDYIQEGLRLKLILGIDFTSNCLIMEEQNETAISWDSLHYTGKDGKEKSEYQKIIEEVWNVVEQYNKKQIIQGYGFGGKPHLQKIDKNEVSFSFPLTGDEQYFQMKGIQHFNEVYVDSSKKIQQFHPRKIAQFLSTTFDRIQKSEKDKEEEEENNYMNYSIIVILTAGEIADFQEVKSFLSKNTCTASASVMLVNIQKQKEEKIEKKEYSLNSKTNIEKKERNIFKYFDYNELNRDPVLLSRQMLKNVPNEIAEYMMIQNKYPQCFNSKQIQVIKRISSS